jgi:hypothetical protein
MNKLAVVVSTVGQYNAVVNYFVTAGQVSDFANTPQENLDKHDESCIAFASTKTPGSVGFASKDYYDERGYEVISFDTFSALTGVVAEAEPVQPVTLTVDDDVVAKFDFQGQWVRFGDVEDLQLSFDEIKQLYDLTQPVTA